MEEIINRCKSGLLQVIKKSDDKALGILRIYHKSLYDYIHNTLCPNGEEEKIRELISYHVIGNFQAPRYSGVLRLIKDRMKELPYDEKSREVRLQYYEEYRKFLALAAFRSLKHFALYMENSPNGILHETMDIMSGWYYYATKMVLDKSVNFILKQMPTGMGKSYSDIILIAWLLGYNPEAQVVKIFGNSNNVSPCFNGICSLIKSKKFGEIFPKFACYNGMDTVFSYRREKPCTMKLDLANKVSLQIYGKESDIDGIRTEFLFLDDITQASDIANIDAHNKDINRYERTWQKRRYDDNNFLLWLVVLHIVYLILFLT
jgi:hypothetical protein